jgi:hypothetical protein
MSSPRESKAAGYQALVDDLGLSTMPLPVASVIRSRGAMRIESSPDQTVQHFPAGYAPEPTPTGQLEFALKHEGVNLDVLCAAFARLDAGQLAAWVRSRPTGKYTRRIWFLYEWSTGRTLDVPDARSVAYVDALGSAEHHTTRAVPSPRHRVRDDLLGVPGWTFRGPAHRCARGFRGQGPARTGPGGRPPARRRIAAPRGPIPST